MAVALRPESSNSRVRLEVSPADHHRIGALSIAEDELGLWTSGTTTIGRVWAAATVSTRLHTTVTTTGSCRRVTMARLVVKSSFRHSQAEV
jgi:hypothetical protein